MRQRPRAWQLEQSAQHVVLQKGRTGIDERRVGQLTANEECDLTHG